jgi:hypothetical protein
LMKAGAFGWTISEFGRIEMKIADRGDEQPLRWSLVLRPALGVARSVPVGVKRFEWGAPKPRC